MPVQAPRPDVVTALWDRIVASTEVEGLESTGCWLWTKRLDRTGYSRLNARCDGKHRTVKVHRATLVLMECRGHHELFWPLYESYGHAGLEADHLCVGNPHCVNPDHLQWLPNAEHVAKTAAARRRARGSPTRPDYRG